FPLFYLGGSAHLPGIRKVSKQLRLPRMARMQLRRADRAYSGARSRNSTVAKSGGNTMYSSRRKGLAQFPRKRDAGRFRDTRALRQMLCRIVCQKVWPQLMAKVLARGD